MKNVFYIMAMFLIIGCAGDELDRDKAAGIIQKFFNYPVTEIINIESVKVGELSEIESQSRDQGSSISNNNQSDIFFITEKGKLIQLNEDSGSIFSIITNELSFNEVTGIRSFESDKRAIVDFTEKRSEITPLGMQLNHQEADLLEKQVTMELYDDGWRIVSNKKEAMISGDTPTTEKPSEILDKETEVISEEDKIEDDTIGESSASFFLLKKAFTEEGEDFVAVDYIGEDGSNNNPKLRIFKITRDFNTSDFCGRFEKSGRIKNFADLKSLKNDSLRLFLVVKNDIVQCIEFTNLSKPQPVKIDEIPQRPRSDSEKQQDEDRMKRNSEDTLQKLKDTLE